MIASIVKISNFKRIARKSEISGISVNPYLEDVNAYTQRSSYIDEYQKSKYDKNIKGKPPISDYTCNNCKNCVNCFSLIMFLYHWALLITWLIFIWNDN